MLKKILVFGCLLFGTASLAHASVWSDLKTKLQQMLPEPPAAVSTQAVLGDSTDNDEAPRIYMSVDNSYSSGGLISQSSVETAGIYISGYRLPDTVDVKIYKASLDDVMRYLVHDKDFKQLNPTLSTSSMTYQSKATLMLAQNTTDFYPLPIEGKGIWYLEMVASSNGKEVKIGAFLVRSEHGVYAVEQDEKLIFWGERYLDFRSVSGGGTVRTFNLQDRAQELASTTFNSEGIAETNLSGNADIAISQNGDDLAIIPLNLTYLNTGYGYATFRAPTWSARYFTFVDRPIYLPGDTVNFKSVIRDDRDAKYTIPSGQAYVTINKNWNEPVKEMTLPISADGTINGTFKLDKNAPVGWYTLKIRTEKDKLRDDANNGYADNEYTGTSDISTASFNVEYYRKPEAQLEIEGDATDIIAGDELTVDIVGSYYSGQPLVGEDIKYTVTAADYYEYSYLMDYQQSTMALSNKYRYGSWYGSQNIKEGTVRTDKLGHAQIEIPTSLTWNEKGKSQVFTVEATRNDGSQDPIFARKNILVRSGKFGLYAKDYAWYAKQNTPFTLPLIAVPYAKNSSVTDVEIKAEIYRQTWERVNSEKEKYAHYTSKTETVGTYDLKTDATGLANLTFTPTQFGNYQLVLVATDSAGNKIRKEFHVYVGDGTYAYYEPGTSDESLSITTDKKTYKPGDSAEVTLISTIPDRDVYLSVVRGSQHRAQVVHLQGKSATISLPLVATDQPNIYLSAASFSTYRLDRVSTNLTIDTADKQMEIQLKPDRSTYGPGDTVTLNISTTDKRGYPLSAEVAVWTVDKAIFALSDSLLGDIFETFWAARSDSTSTSHSLRGVLVQNAERGGGCFVGDTEITLASGDKKMIKDVEVGDIVQTFSDAGDLVSHRVTRTFEHADVGYLLINGRLRVTPDHLIYANGNWREASQIQVGNILRAEHGAEVVESLSYQAQKIEVYNLEVETAHTFIADGIWVHNQKGESRSVFKDVAYWNPTVRTDSEGRATLTFKLPDNLTSWVIAAVGSTTSTAVGQTTAEIKVSKDVVIKPILPNLIRVGDQLTLTALARNFTDSKDTYAISLDVKGATTASSEKQVVTLHPTETAPVSWSMTPDPKAKELKTTVGMRSETKPKSADIVTNTIPVVPFGFHDRTAQFKVGTADFAFDLPRDAQNDETVLSLSLAPSLVTSLQSSMQYLLQYPYGCVEQLTSRLYPALMAKANAQLFASAMAGKNIDDYIRSGLSKIDAARGVDYGWAWWQGGKKSSFITSYVLEAYLEARRLGYKEETELGIAAATQYLSQKNTGNTLSDEERVLRRYGLSLVGKAEQIPAPSGDLSQLDTDLIAMAVIGNYRAGNHDSATNGLAVLKSKAQTEGDAVYWQSLNYDRLSTTGSSTAWAVRALALAGERELAARGVRYLINHRSHDYWYNSYATVVASEAILDLYRQSGEAKTNYRYQVKLDDEVLASGQIATATQVLKPLIIDHHKLADSTHRLTVSYEGEGQLYSTLTTDLFRTDPALPALDQGVKITREYVNDRHPDQTVALGDTVRVEFRVANLTTDARYLVIEDQLPAGMVPINARLLNEQYDNGASGYEYYTNKEYTQNGANLTIYNPRNTTYSYKARVVSTGKFKAPPAVTSLMYSPEVMGYTTTDQLTLTETSSVIPTKAIEKVVKKMGIVQYVAIGAFVIAAIAITVIVYRKKRKPSISQAPLPPHDET